MGRITIEDFLGCAESAVSILNKLLRQHVIHALTLANEVVLHHEDVIQKSRLLTWHSKGSGSHDPFPHERVGSGNKTILAMGGTNIVHV